MFNCYACNKTSEAREPMRRVVAEKRTKVYRNLVQGVMTESRGWEIAKEVALCTKCYEKVTQPATN